MSEEKTIRCTKCYEEFSEEETKKAPIDYIAGYTQKS